jgi:hypothetical protein
MIVVVAAFTILYFYNLTHEQMYALGEEISDYPIEGLNFTVNSWQNITHFSNNHMGADATENTTLILINYTLRNTLNVNFSWHFNINSNYAVFNELLKISVPTLKYDSQQQSSWSGSNWVVNLDLQNFDGDVLMPNQIWEGVFLYSIPKGFSPAELVCSNENLRILINPHQSQ